MSRLEAKWFDVNNEVIITTVDDRSRRYRDGGCGHFLHDSIDGLSSIISTLWSYTLQDDVAST